MKTIRTTKGIKGLALLGLGAGLALPMGSWAQAQAQPDPNAAPMAQNPANRAGRNKGQKNKGQNGKKGAKAVARMQERELAAAEDVAGKPLTEEQKQKVRDNITAREEALLTAREKYVADLAASLGMEPDAVRIKLREAQAKARAANGGQGNRGKRAGRRGGGAGAGAAAAPAAGG